MIYQQPRLTSRNQWLVVAFKQVDCRVRDFVKMVQTWSSWKRYPDAHQGGHVEAPIGPGVYEVRSASTGRVVAFGHAGNVANAITDLKVNGGISPLARLFGKQPLVSRVNDLEYRTCAATSRAEARTAANRLTGLRQSAWRRRVDMGSSAGMR